MTGGVAPDGTDPRTTGPEQDLGDPGGGQRPPSVVAVGGGHGLAATLRAARRLTPDVTAVVSVADDGGSSGRLRHQRGLPPVGDLRRCLSALAGADPEWADLLEHRFTGGDLDGHPVGNIMLAALIEQGRDLIEALSWLARRIGATGRVLPAASVPVTLVGERADGTVARGQVAVARAGGVTRIRFEPAEPPVPAEVVSAITAADLIVVGPGSLYTSVLAAAAVPEVRRALAGASAPVVYVCNLFPQPTETPDLDAAGHLRALEDHGIVPSVVICDPRGLVVPDPRTVTVEVSRPHRRAHDPERLAAALGAVLTDATRSDPRARVRR